MSIEHNIAMRLAAQEMVDLATTEYGSDQRFWEVIREHAIRVAPPAAKPPATIEPMSDEHARTFGRRIVNFGQWAHHRYDDVPLDYLEWLADQNVQLIRYIRSRRVQAEMTTREQPTEEQDR